MNHYIKPAKNSKQIQKDSKKKTPWWFYLNVKDLVKAGIDTNGDGKLTIININ